MNTGTLQYSKQNKDGFLLVELLIALSVVAVFLPVTILIAYRITSVQNLLVTVAEIIERQNKRQDFLHASNSISSEQKHRVYACVYSLPEPIATSSSGYAIHEYARYTLPRDTHGDSNCLLNPFLVSEKLQLQSIVELPDATGIISDIIFSYPYLIIAVDGVLSREADIYIYRVAPDALGHWLYVLERSINTGPGVKVIRLFNKYIISGETSAKTPLKIIDVVSGATLGQFTALGTSIYGATQSLALDDANLYVGLAKNPDKELFIFELNKLAVALQNVTSTPLALIPDQSYELNSQVDTLTPSHIFPDKVFFSTPSHPQFHMYDSLTGAILVDNSFIPGYAVQDIKSIWEHRETVGMARTVGGFNVVKNPELLYGTISLPLLFSASYTEDLAASVLGHERFGDVEVLNIGVTKNTAMLRNWVTKATKKLVLPHQMFAMRCVDDVLYFGGERNNQNKLLVYELK